jgi:uncharacterized repeat protein (TIGR03806 family)
MKGSQVTFWALFLSTAVAAHAQLVRLANSTLVLPPALPSASQFTTENALGTRTFSSPMVVTSIRAETNRLFVAERGGVIKVVPSLTTPVPAPTTYLNLADVLGAGETFNTEGENGFLSLVFHPDFATNRTLFVYYSFTAPEPDGTKYFQRLHRIVVNNAASNAPTIESHGAMLTVVDRATNHNGGDLHFGPDGYLYLSLGDEGSGGDAFDNARFINHRYDPVGQVWRTGFWGQMLRLDVDGRPGSINPNSHQQASSLFPSAVHADAYKIPPDNPFIGATLWHGQTIPPETVRTEIWATGLRNPFRWSFDVPTGRLFLGDVGQNAYEEINIIEKGGDYGWSWREGTHPYGNPPDPKTPPAGFNPKEPIFDYGRTLGNCVTGGAVYRGSRLTELFGAYLFADTSGEIIALRQNGGTWSSQIIGTQTNIYDFGHDPRDGDLLFCSGSTVRRLVRSSPTGDPPPATLSALGAFSNLATLQPHAGIVPYEVNVPFWSDHALKRRWFSIRNMTDDVTYSRDGNWTLPTGMVWIKHFDLETTRVDNVGDPSSSRKLETRVLVKTADATYGLSYRWRADQTDADLVPETGMNDPIAVSVDGIQTTQTWRFPSRSECMTCHTAAGGHALSFNTRQLNREHLYGAQTLNQITALEGAGYFSAAVDGVHTLPAFAKADDVSQSLEWRARSYFAVNCSQCHQPGGPASGNWDARATVPTDMANIVKGVLLNNYGDVANRFVAPGDPLHSVALQRIRGIPSRMPPIGSNEIDQSAVDLLTAWINQDLPTRESFAEWQVAEFGSPLPPESAPDEDADGDGLTNRMEYLIGGNPHVATPPSVLKIQPIGDTLHFDFSLPPNRSMVIETSETLQAGSWQPWEVQGNTPIFPAAGGARTLEFPMPGSPNQFFRGRVAAP